MLAFLPSRPLYYCCYTFNLYGYYKLHNTLLLFLCKHSILFLRDWSMEKSMKYGVGGKALDSPTFGLPDQWDPFLIFKPRFCRLSVTCRQIPLNWCLPLPYIAQFLRFIWFLFSGRGKMTFWEEWLLSEQVESQWQTTHFVIFQGSGTL